MRTSIHIDGGYVEKIVSGRLDYRKFPQAVLKAVGGGHLVRTYYYDCVPQYESNKQKFMDALSFLPNFCVRYGYLDTHVGGGGVAISTQKMTDVQIALDIVRAAQSGIEQVVVVCGDMDIVPALEWARELFVEVVLVHGNGFGESHGISQTLKDATDRRVMWGPGIWEECRWKNEENM